jgi:hypothetical protein
VLAAAKVSTSPLIVQEAKSAETFPMVFFLPHMKQLSDGFLQMRESICPIPAIGAGSTEANCAVQEALNILQRLGQVQWQQPQMLCVTIYLSKILHFGSRNNHHCEFFETCIPSLHTCVVVGKFSLPVGFCVLLDCLIQCGSGAHMCLSKDGGSYMDVDTCSMSSMLWDVLHIQSLLHWAPVLFICFELVKQTMCWV